MEEEKIITNTENSTKESVTTLPFNLPTILGGGKGSTLKLPFKLPAKLGVTVGLLRLPFKLPAKLGEVGNTRKCVKLPVQETCVYITENKTIKLPIIESSSCKYIKIPVTEKGWVFYGLIMEENIVKQMSSQITLTEDIKARILADYEMINGTDVSVHWYGEKVKMVETHMKMSLEENYTKVGVYNWDEGQAIIALGAGEFDLLLKGVGETGFSEKITLGEPTYVEINLAPVITKNEKLYQIPVEYTSEYRIKIDY